MAIRGHIIGKANRQTHKSWVSSLDDNLECVVPAVFKVKVLRSQTKRTNPVPGFVVLVVTIRVEERACLRGSVDTQEVDSGPDQAFTQVVLHPI